MSWESQPILVPSIIGMIEPHPEDKEETTSRPSKAFIDMDDAEKEERKENRRARIRNRRDMETDEEREIRRTKRRIYDVKHGEKMALTSSQQIQVRRCVMHVYDTIFWPNNCRLPNIPSPTALCTSRTLTHKRREQLKEAKQQKRRDVDARRRQNMTTAEREEFNAKRRLLHHKRKEATSNSGERESGSGSDSISHHPSGHASEIHRSVVPLGSQSLMPVPRDEKVSNFQGYNSMPSAHEREPRRHHIPLLHSGRMMVLHRQLPVPEQMQRSVPVSLALNMVDSV